MEIERAIRGAVALAERQGDALLVAYLYQALDVARRADNVATGTREDRR